MLFRPFWCPLAWQYQLHLKGLKRVVLDCKWKPAGFGSSPLLFLPGAKGSLSFRCSPSQNPGKSSLGCQEPTWALWTMYLISWGTGSILFFPHPDLVWGGIPEPVLLLP